MIFLPSMADLPSKRQRTNGKAVVPRSSKARNNDSAASTLLCENSVDKMKSKQATLDRYWSKKPDHKVEAERKQTTDENTEAEPVPQRLEYGSTLPETQEYGSSLAQKEEVVCKQASDDDVSLETVPETLQNVSTPGTDATPAISEYDSDSVAASEHSAADDLSTVASDSPPEHLELGTSFDEMAATFKTRRDLPPLCPSTNHTVLFVPGTADERCTSIPEPNLCNIVFEEARWDNDHVRLPYSPQNKLLINNGVVSRWGKIVSHLRAAECRSSYDIEKAILSYNKYKWDFTELHRYFQGLTEEEHDLFFAQTFPKVVKLAVDLPSVCTQPIPLLRKQKPASVTMSQQQAACLLANAFFCTFPSRNMNFGSGDDVPRLPSINFNTLYRRASARSCHARHAKLDCLFHYFKRVTTDMPRGTVTFTRQVILLYIADGMTTPHRPDVVLQFM